MANIIALKSYYSTFSLILRTKKASVPTSLSLSEALRASLSLAKPLLPTTLFGLYKLSSKDSLN